MLETLRERKGLAADWFWLSLSFSWMEIGVWGSWGCWNEAWRENANLRSPEPSPKSPFQEYWKSLSTVAVL